MAEDLIFWTGERFLPSIGKEMPEVWLEHLNRYYMAIDICKNKDVLDIASGEGYGSALLARDAKSVLGIDIDSMAVQHANNKYVRPNLQYMTRSAIDLNLANNKYEVVTCFEILEHISEQEQLIAQVQNVLNRDGVFIVSTPNKYVHDNELENQNEYHVKELYFSEFESLLTEKFKYCYFYAQRQYSTAQIWSIYEKSGLTNDRTLRFLEDESFEIDRNERAPVYYIAVCSNERQNNLFEQYYLADNNHLIKQFYNNQINKINYNYSHNFVKVYFDTGEGYSEYNVQKLDFDCTNGFADINLKIKIPGDVVSIRIDPANETYCIVRCISVTLDNKLLPIYMANFEESSIEEIHFFNTKDSQYIYNNLKATVGKELIIKFSVMTLQSLDFYQIFRTMQDKTNEEKENLIQEIMVSNIQKNALETQLSNTNSALEALNSQKNALENQLIKANSAFEDLNIQKNALETQLIESNSLRKDLNNHVNSLNSQKDAFLNIIREKKGDIQELAEVTSLIEDMFSERNEYIQRISSFEAELNDLRNSSSWKLTKPIRKLFDVFKSFMRSTKFTHLILKGASSLKNNGIRNTFARVRLYFQRKNDVYHFELEQQNANAVEISEAYVAYDSEYQKNQKFDIYHTDVKTLAFFLPQFHAIPENDNWWGMGFTEWTNTKVATPRFEGHYQPREPHSDIGYYDLSKVEVLANQAKLAKEHGLFGFCFYHYWFSGERLLEKPVDMLIQHPEIDISFCLCWANENWTKAWDGQNKDIIMEQKYTEDDPIKFIDDIKRYVNDSRYIKVGGKPVIIVYNPGHIPNIKYVFEKWRKRAAEIGIGDILIWICQTANNTADILQIKPYIDAEIEFPPHNMWYDAIGVRDLDVGGKEAYIYNYQKLVQILRNRFLKKGEIKESVPLYRCSMMGWDNAARRKNGWTTFYAYSLKSFYTWLRIILEEAHFKFEPEERFVFVNAWNEWAEGTYLEPDQKYGYANINTLSKALFNLPLDNPLVVINHDSDYTCENKCQLSDKPAIAVQIHLFYPEVVDEIIDNLSMIPYKFDCYVSTDTKKKVLCIKEQFASRNLPNMDKLVVERFENRGRDVAPFLIQLEEVINDYDYICHLHSKKTSASEYGESWRKYLYRHLLGSQENIYKIIDMFETKSELGIVFPETYPVLNKQAEWGGNKGGCVRLMERLSLDYNLPDDIVFPVGNMFWARVKAVQNLFTTKISMEDFPEEQGQTNATLAHQIERIWVFVAQKNQFTYSKVFNNCMPASTILKRKRISFYVHYDSRNIVSDEDLHTISFFSKCCDEFVVITNSELSQDNIDRVKPYSSVIIERANKGFDFGAWKDALIKYGFENLEKYDQVILLNNSFYGPYYEMNSIFEEMQSKKVDFWGMTVFPYSSDGSYLQKDKIPEHIQSYFQVFNRNVFTSKAFKNFWLNVQYENTLIDVIAKYESELTSILKKQGYEYSVFLDETKYISKYLLDYSILYTNPYSLIILGLPFLKKKSEQYMSVEERAKLNQILAQFQFE